ncbi:glycosyltransferase [Moorena sp. SIO3I6]|uniref:glycosyltransferase n=1 Tax=Moorena sp. SIO3I6 TaxID=2607831 RepID=UPI0013F6B838|nr:glycosyltransferase [Moorena sp. SIO3I6]NEP26810.1 glycosyltransferase [Moorena sp. SIO3I6]
MKILHVIPSIGSVRGGPSHAALGMVKALRQSGIDTEIATTNDNGCDLLDVPLYQRTEYQGVPVWFLPRFSPPLKEFIFSAALTRWLWQHIRDYDIIHTHYLFSYPSTCAGLIARRQGIPYIVRTIGQLTPWALAQSRLKKQIYTSLIERHNLNRAAAIHCTSGGEAEDVRNFGIQTPTITLPLGVNQPVNFPEAKQKLRHIHNIPAQTPIVLFISRLHNKKRPDLLIQALNKLATQNCDFHLIFAGSGESDYENQLKNLVASTGLTSRTTFTGFITGTDKELVLQGSDIFVLPSFSENFGIVIAEAMAAGLPVIITPGVQIAPEIAQAKAGLVVEGELDALSNAIAQLLASPSLRNQLGENGKQLVSSRYSWSAIAQNLASVYDKIIAGKKLS